MTDLPVSEPSASPLTGARRRGRRAGHTLVAESAGWPRPGSWGRS